MVRFRFIIFFIFTINVSAQENKENNSIGTQEVLVVKSYTPNLSDAFKIKNTAEFHDSLLNAKIKLEYKFKAVPVVSTFQPNKATPLKLQQRSSSTPYNTFFSGAFGNKSQLYLNISSLIEIDRGQRFGIRFYRDGFGANVDNSLLKSNQSHSQFGLHHNLRSNEYNANTQIQFTSNNNNYFGLYDTSWNNFLINNLNPEINRNFFKLRTNWNWYNSLLNNITFQANISSDNYNSFEQQVAIGTGLENDLGKGKIKAEVKIQGFKTNFDRSYFKLSNEQYSQGQGTVDVFWKGNFSDLKMIIGAGVTYLLGVDDFSSLLLYYPKIEIFYNKSGSTISPYLISNGGVHQNTYKTLSESNPFLAPTTSLAPTFNKYNAKVGIRSSLASILNFDLGFIFDQIENFTYFVRLPYDNTNEEFSYRLSNSFQSQYAYTDVYGFNAAIQIDLTKNNFVRFKTVYRIFDSNKEEYLWNVPALEMNWESQFKFKDRFLFSLNGTFWGDRKAALHPIFLQQDLNDVQIIPEDLPFFIRSTAHITYKISDQFDVFVKGRFSTKGVNGRWAYYPEPPMLLVGGVTYKFDFQY